MLIKRIVWEIPIYFELFMYYRSFHSSLVKTKEQPAVSYL